MTRDDALRLALEALHYCFGGTTREESERRRVISVLKAVLEQPAIPRENSQEAQAAIEKALAEYSYPSNPQNAARAGWRAARLYAASEKLRTEPLHGNAEDLYAVQQRDLNCPACGGSGHVDDSQPQPQQEPVAMSFTSLLNEAEEIVRAKSVWKRFIDGTPLSNDVPVWMTAFALDVASRTTPPRHEWAGLTEEEIDSIYFHSFMIFKGDEGGIRRSQRQFARAIEQALKEKNQ